MKPVLSIAGSDCSGGAGIQADLKAMSAHGVYGMTVITALTAQNTTGVYGVQEVTPDFVKHQIDLIFEDIPPCAIKVGMVSSTAIIETIANALKQYEATNIVIDPVMFSTSGHALLQEEAMNALVEELLPLANLITPNLAEAEALSHRRIENRADMLSAARVIKANLKGSVLIKGGHLDEKAADLLLTEDGPEWFETERIDNPNTHGTGCTLSSAIAANLALGYDLKNAVKRSKAYITESLKSGLNLGKGRGPLNHFVKIEE